MKKIDLPGVNIQWPWSELLMCGEKSIETRKYPLPDRLKNQLVAVIETPGKKRKDFKARIIGVIIFKDCVQYKDERSWRKDFNKHRVGPDDHLYKFKQGTKKFGWIVGKYCRLKKPISPPRSRGMVYATNCKIPCQEIKSIL